MSIKVGNTGVDVKDIKIRQGTVRYDGQPSFQVFRDRQGMWNVWDDIRDEPVAQTEDLFSVPQLIEDYVEELEL